MIGVSGELALFFLSGHVASLSAGLRKMSSVSRPRGDDGNVNVRGLAIVCEYEVHARPLSIPEHRGNDLFNEHVCAKVFLNEISETPDEVIVALDDAPACFADDAMALLCVDGRWANLSVASDAGALVWEVLWVGGGWMWKQEAPGGRDDEHVVVRLVGFDGGLSEL